MNNRRTLFGTGTIALLILGGVTLFTSSAYSQAASKGARMLKGADDDQIAVGENQDDGATLLPGLQSKALISLNDAVRIAESQGQGKPYKAEMEVENNALIYSVSSTNGETLIDAGDGKVLARVSKGSKETESHWKGSLKVSVNAEGGGETKSEG
ncbi:MAG: PepSY domain-containing protein [Cyanobium sp. ELA712]